MTGPEIRRLLLAVTLMMGVIVGTNLLFPSPPEPPAPEGAAELGEAGEAGEVPAAGEDASGAFPLNGVEGRPGAEAAAEPAETADSVAERLVRVETPLFRLEFSNYGATVRSVELFEYRSFARDGVVQLMPPDARRVLGGLWAYGTGADTVSLSRFPFSVTPADGIRLGADADAEGGPDSASTTPPDSSSPRSATPSSPTRTWCMWTAGFRSFPRRTARPWCWTWCPAWRSTNSGRRRTGA